MKEWGRDRSLPLCACMVSRSEWYRASAPEAKSLASAVFENLRGCPFCRLKGRGQWGQFTPRDRSAAKLGKPKRPSRLAILAAAFRIAASTFVETLRLIGAGEA